MNNHANLDDAIDVIETINPKDARTLEVVNLDQFVVLLSKWHQNRVAQLQHLMDIPEGTLASLNEETSIELTGDARIGFLIGVTVGLSHFGELPFVAEIDESSTTPDTQQPVSAKPA